MFSQDFEKAYVAPVIATAAIYEAVAIISRGRIPTLSRLSWNMYKKPHGKLTLWLILGWLLDHLLVNPEYKVGNVTITESTVNCHGCSFDMGDTHEA